MELLTTTEREKERVATFIREQEAEWNAQEQQTMFAKRLQGKDYEPRPFPGFDENVALAQVRNGWKSKLEMRFEAKKRKEGW